MTDETLNNLCEVPDEESCLNDIKSELSDEGFKINNFNKGGVFYIIIRIFVRIYIELKKLTRTIIKNSTISDAEDDWLYVKGADFGKTLKNAVKTQGYITITRSDYSNALQISKGHMFKTSPDVNGNELKYYVLENTVIAAGDSTGKVLVEAEEPGTTYNVSANKINVSMIHLDGVSSVTNDNDWLYLEGSETEDQESFRSRVLGSWSELSERTIEEKLINIAKKVSGVLDVKVNAQHPRGQGTVDIIVTSTAGAATQTLLDKVESETSYLKGNYGDWEFKSSIINTQDVSLTLYIAKDMSRDGIKELAENLIESMMQLSSRDELNTLYQDEIRFVLQSKIDGYKKVIFTTPSSDIELNSDNVIMLGTATVTVKNIGGD